MNASKTADVLSPNLRGTISIRAETSEETNPQGTVPASGAQGHTVNADS